MTMGTVHPRDHSRFRREASTMPLGSCWHRAEDLGENGNIRNWSFSESRKMSAIDLSVVSTTVVLCENVMVTPYVLCLWITAGVLKNTLPSFFILFWNTFFPIYTVPQPVKIEIFVLAGILCRHFHGDLNSDSQIRLDSTLVHGCLWISRFLEYFTKVNI